MTVPDLEHVRYVFSCLRCGVDWTAEYDVSERVDCSGDVITTYITHGAPATAPGTERCPGCGGIRSRRLPQQHRARTETSASGQR